LARAFSNRGNAYLAAGDHDRAIGDYNDAIRLDRRLAAAYIGRGIAYQARKDYDRAIADYDEAIRLDPKYREDRRFAAAYRAGPGNLHRTISGVSA